MWKFGHPDSLEVGPIQSYDYAVLDPEEVGFYITLSVTDVLGCTDTIRDTLTASAPDPNFVRTSSGNICVGDTVGMMPFQSGLIYDWDFGNGTTSTQESPTAIYLTAGVYDVTLSVM